MFLFAALAFAPPMRHEPLPGVYCYSPRPDLKVHVSSSAAAAVHWMDAGVPRECAVVYTEDRGYVFDEPLASYARQAGLILSCVEGDQDTLFVTFDGRLKFVLPLRLSEEEPPGGRDMCV